jgi:hypothetical protein
VDEFWVLQRCWETGCEWTTTLKSVASARFVGIRRLNLAAVVLCVCVRGWGVEREVFLLQIVFLWCYGESPWVVEKDQTFVWRKRLCIMTVHLSRCWFRFSKLVKKQVPMSEESRTLADLFAVFCLSQIMNVSRKVDQFIMHRFWVVYFD